MPHGLICVAAIVAFAAVCVVWKSYEKHREDARLNRLRWRGQVRVVHQTNYAGEVCWAVQDRGGFGWFTNSTHGTEADAIAAADAIFAELVASQRVVRQ